MQQTSAKSNAMIKPFRNLGRVLSVLTGGDLLSQAVSNQVPSAHGGLTAVFGMGTGGTPQPSPPDQ